MKTARRQELRSNELAQYLEELRDFLRRYGNYVIIGVVVIAAILLVWIYQKRSASEALTEAIKQMRAMPSSTDEEVRSSVEKLERLASESDNEGLVIQTLRRRAAMAMRRAHAAEDGKPSIEFLDLAEAAYQGTLDRFPNRPLDVGVTLCGLASIEVDRFVLDSDPAHKEAARRYLQRIRDDVQLTGTPIVSVALARLNTLDEAFLPIVIAAALPTAAGPPLEGPSEGPRFDIQPVGSGDFKMSTTPAEKVPRHAREQVGSQTGTTASSEASNTDSRSGAEGTAGQTDESGFTPAEPEQEQAEESSGQTEVPPTEGE